MVEILVPHHLHLPITLVAIAAGKNVALQKPMALTLAEADQMIAAADDAGVVFKIFENFVFYPPIQRARQMIDNGDIGDVLAIRLKSNTGFSTEGWWVPQEALAWRFDVAKAGGGPQVFDDGHHKFATAWYLHGMPVDPLLHRFAVQRGIGLAVADLVAVRRWRGRFVRGDLLAGAEAAREVLRPGRPGGDHRYERGHLGHPWAWPDARCGACGHVPQRADRTSRRHGCRLGVSFENSGRHFIDVLTDGGDPVLTGRQGRDLLAYSLAALESAATGQAVQFTAAPAPPPTG